MGSIIYFLILLTQIWGLTWTYFENENEFGLDNDKSFMIVYDDFPYQNYIWYNCQDDELEITVQMSSVLSKTLLRSFSKNDFNEGSLLIEKFF